RAPPGREFRDLVVRRGSPRWRWKTGAHAGGLLRRGGELQRTAHASKLLPGAEKAETSAAGSVGRSGRIEADAGVLHFDFEEIVRTPKRRLRRCLPVFEDVHDELADRAKDDRLGGVVQRLVRSVVDHFDLDPMALLDVLREPGDGLLEAEIIKHGWAQVEDQRALVGDRLLDEL